MHIKIKIFIMLLCCIFVLNGCNKQDLLEDDVREDFNNSYILNDGRIIFFTFDVLYNDSSLYELFVHNEITIDDFINKLDFTSDMNDGGSKLYKYNRNNKIFGNDDFYVLVCNSYMNIDDIFVSKNISSLTNKCVTNIDELNKINNKIIDYFTTNGVDGFDNFCGNYVDKTNGVVVVSLLDISKHEQDRFKKMVVDSELIEFRKGEKGRDD